MDAACERISEQTDQEDGIGAELERICLLVEDAEEMEAKATAKLERTRKLMAPAPSARSVEEKPSSVTVDQSSRASRRIRSHPYPGRVERA